MPVAVLIFAILYIAVAVADELPPTNSRPLSEVITMVERHGISVITEVEFEDGAWKLEARDPAGKELKLRINPITGEIIDKRPW
jgi:hypothetical protein